uniref:Uncharacterized protein n=1 Tax=Meloidogyne enterolobii TaxID=390850 RepID=A0A6V7V5R4_MELEN|nr:unnamed protein product [Meloidogyne enterolobii]
MKIQGHKLWRPLLILQCILILLIAQMAYCNSSNETIEKRVISKPPDITKDIWKINTLVKSIFTKGTINVNRELEKLKILNPKILNLFKYKRGFERLNIIVKTHLKKKNNLIVIKQNDLITNYEELSHSLNILEDNDFEQRMETKLVCDKLFPQELEEYYLKEICSQLQKMVKIYGVGLENVYEKQTYKLDIKAEIQTILEELDGIFYIFEIKKNDVPRISYDDLQQNAIKLNDNSLDNLGKYSLNYQQLTAAFTFFSIEENNKALLSFISEIKKGEDKAMLKEFSIAYMQKYAEKLHTALNKKNSLFTSKNKQAKLNDKITQQLNNVDIAINLGYMRFIYMEEFCKNVDKIYKGDKLVKFKEYMKDYCTEKINKILDSLKTIIKYD